MIFSHFKPSCAIDARSEQLTQLMLRELDCSPRARFPFARFMELALYTPGLGYYDAGFPIFGKKGDFTTAPEISPLFARCLARYCQPILDTLCGYRRVVLELGAGTGRMAADFLLELEALGTLPEHYWVVEISANLRLQQWANWQRWVPHLLSRIKHVDDLPIPPIQGIIIANEVADALPVHTFFVQNGSIKERYVAWNGERFVWQLGLPSTLAVQQALLQVTSQYLQEVEGYASEFSLALEGWVQSLGQTLSQGLLLLVDYGYPQREYYHPHRTQGTLRCYYRQQITNDPLLRVGLQDITSHVDFTQVARSANQAGLSVEAFTSQAAFLLSNGLLNWGEQCYSEELRVKMIGQVHQLVSPAEMGELCKVMVLTKGRWDEYLLSLEPYDRQLSL